MNADNTINDYIEALTTRAELAGDDRLEFALGWMFETLKTLKLQSYELEVLQSDTRALRDIIKLNESK